MARLRVRPPGCRRLQVPCPDLARLISWPTSAARAPRLAQFGWGAQGGPARAGASTKPLSFFFIEIAAAACISPMRPRTPPALPVEAAWGWAARGGAAAGLSFPLTGWQCQFCANATELPRRTGRSRCRTKLSWVSASHRGHLISSMNASNSRPKPILNYRVFFQGAQNNRADSSTLIA